MVGFGLGRNKKRKLRPIGDGVKPIDSPIMGTEGTRGMVGRAVKPIDRKKKNIFDPFS